ncbi:MAG: phosphatase PAP2 family protein [Candidatus Doudnabacteria bacterium]
MNEALFHVINNLAGKSHVLDALGIFLADKFLYVFFAIVIGLWLSRKLRPNVYLALGSALIARGIIVEILKRIINHPRPYEILQNIHQLLADNEHGMSFPSGHAVIYFSLAFGFWKTEYFWPFFVAATLGSLARVFVGVHYPADIVTSAVIALLTVWVIKKALNHSRLFGFRA